MDRSVWSRGRRRLVAVAVVGLGPGLAGCDLGVSTPVTTPPPRPSAPAPEEVRRPASDATPAGPEVSWDTERDRKFARYLQEKSGVMVRKAAVGIERRGLLNIEISRAVAPEDTLPLTKSLMAGARKDFPDRPITIAMFDPQGEPILKARYRPDRGVSYQIAGGAKSAEKADRGEEPTGDDALRRRGVTERDRKFAAWAEGEAKPLLRYVEADLERHGRLWFGVTREVKPEDVKPLTRSLLLGARKEFPRAELVATVFDPDGEKIGRARLDRDGEVQWER